MLGHRKAQEVFVPDNRKSLSLTTGSLLRRGFLDDLRRDLQKVLRRVLRRCLVVGFTGTKGFSEGFLEAGFPESGKCKVLIFLRF